MPSYRYKRPRIGWGPREGWEYANGTAQTLAGWSLYDPNNRAGGAAPPASDQLLEGTKAAKLVISVNAASADVMLWRTFSGLVAGATYNVRVWGRYSSANFPARLGAAGGAARPTTWTVTASTANVWQQLAMTAVADASGRISVAVGGTPAAGTGFNAWFDDLRVHLDVVLRDPLEQAVAYSEPREDFESIEFSSGVEDAWDGGDNYLLAGAARWLPKDLTSGNTGWDGTTGWDAMLAYARRKHVLDLFPDESDLTTYYRVLLREPMRDRPQLEANGTRRVELLWKSADGRRFDGY